MPIIPHWFLPTNGDSRSDLSLGNAVGGAGSRVIDANGIEGGAGTGLVRSHQQVADRIADYHALGIDEFILSGYPHLEEAYQLGEGVLPILRRHGLLAPATPEPEILEV